MGKSKSQKSKFEPKVGIKTIGMDQFEDKFAKFYAYNKK